MWRLQQKLKKVGRRLSQWSRKTIGDVYEQVEEWEAKVQNLEDINLLYNTEQGTEEMNKVHAEYILWLNKQESLLKQKSQIKWFEEGDCNSKYFHAVIRERRRRLQLHRIKNKRGKWVSENENISKAAIKHFEDLFNLKQPVLDHRILQCITTCITDEDSESISCTPLEEEIKKAVFTMSASSCAGPDGFSGRFFHSCWDIIKNDITDFVQSFFNGGTLTKFFTHTLLVLLPNVEDLSSFSELRHVSSSNFTSKIITKIISRRLNPMLTTLISENQSGFLKGKLITENAQLAQEIVQDIKKKNIGEIW
uniref:Reverse transcriptase domain-containing protein n=1 Tax=Nicotiana tabacum TaxID=4097 RepID=A0A1S4DID2_TOBAC|nr:PREDICTED: uncharacterized protein LOC107830159 [Nicotiana tabacum]